MPVFCICLIGILLDERFVTLVPTIIAAALLFSCVGSKFNVRLLTNAFLSLYILLAACSTNFFPNSVIFRPFIPDVLSSMQAGIACSGMCVQAVFNVHAPRDIHRSDTMLTTSLVPRLLLKDEADVHVHAMLTNGRTCNAGGHYMRCLTDATLSMS